MGLLSAASASASEENVVVLNLETVATDIGPWQLVESRVFNVYNVPAIQTDKMMVLVQLRVEPGRRAGMAGPGHQAKRNQRSQDAIDSHARKLGQARMDGVKNLVGGRVVPAAQNRFEHGAPLHRDRQSALVIGRFKALDAPLLVCRSHGVGMINYTR